MRITIFEINKIKQSYRYYNTFHMCCNCMVRCLGMLYKVRKGVQLVNWIDNIIVGLL